MSDSTKSSEDGTSAAAYFQQAVDAFQQRELDRSEQLSKTAAELYEQAGNTEVSQVYNHLGAIEYWRSNFDAAERWYQKALEIENKSGDRHGSAKSYHELSFVSTGREEFKSAEKWLKKALRIRLKLGDEIRAAESYCQLGLVAYWQDDLDAAERWYRKALEIEERKGEELAAAKTYNNMDAVANARENFEAAEKLLWKSIRIKERLGDELGAARSYLQLGVVANHRCDYDAAERWYLKSLEIDENQNDEVTIAKTYFNLSSNARDQQNEEAAEAWLQKALHIFDERRDVSGAIEVARIAEQAQRFSVAEKLYRTALKIAKQGGNAKFEAYSYHYLGRVAGLQGDFEASRKWCEKALEMHIARGAADWAASCCMMLGNSSLATKTEKGRDFGTAKQWYRKALDLKKQHGEKGFPAMPAFGDTASITYSQGSQVGQAPPVPDNGGSTVPSEV